MELQIICHSNDETHIKPVLTRIVDGNVATKLDGYLEQFNKPDAVGLIDVTVDKNKKGLFDGKIHSVLDGNAYHFERQDYKNMDDLVNHLFDHFKEALSNRKQEEDDVMDDTSLEDDFDDTL